MEKINRSFMEKLYQRFTGKTFSTKLLLPVPEPENLTGKKLRIGLGKNKSNKMSCRRPARQIGFKAKSGKGCRAYK